MAQNIHKIISCDPASTRNLGWSILELGDVISCMAGTFVVPDTQEVWQTYWPIYQFMDDLLTKEHPDVVVIEKTSSFRSSKAGAFITGQVSHCMGVIFAVCGKHNMNVEFAFPTSVKMQVAGHGKATKSQIVKAVKQFVPNIQGQNLSEHSYDAVANIIFYLLTTGKIEPLVEYPWLTTKQQKTRSVRLKNGKKELG